LKRSSISRTARRGRNACKTHLAVALATLAVEAVFRCYFTNAEQMVANIAQAIHEGNLASKLKTYTAPSVLVIDDVGLLPMDRAAASAFYRVVNVHYEKQHSTTATTNRGLPNWGEIFGDTVVAAAVTDPPNGVREELPPSRAALCQRVTA